MAAASEVPLAPEGGGADVQCVCVEGEAECGRCFSTARRGGEGFLFCSSSSRQRAVVGRGPAHIKLHFEPTSCLPSQTTLAHPHRTGAAANCPATAAPPPLSPQFRSAVGRQRRPSEERQPATLPAWRACQLGGDRTCPRELFWALFSSEKGATDSLLKLTHDQWTMAMAINVYWTRAERGQTRIYVLSIRQFTVADEQEAIMRHRAPGPSNLCTDWGEQPRIRRLLANRSGAWAVQQSRRPGVGALVVCPMVHVQLPG